MEILILGAALICLGAYTTWLHLKQKKAEFERQLFEALWDTMWDHCESMENVLHGEGSPTDKIEAVNIKNQWMIDVLNCEADPGFEIQIEGEDDD